jgi:hypothetical protein
VDAEALSFIPLAKQLGVAIHSFFQPTYNPAAKWPPGGSAAASSSPPPSLSPAPQHTDAHSNGVGVYVQVPAAAPAQRLPSPAPSAAAAAPSSASASVAAAASAAEGGLKAEGGEPQCDGEHHSGSEEGGLSSDSDQSGSEDSQQQLEDDGDPSALPADGAVGGRKKKKKWDRHSSLVALSKAVDHVCASATRDEAVLTSLQAILRNAMQKSGKHTQNTLRELMKRLQEKHAGQGSDAAPAAVDDLGARMQGLHLQNGVPSASAAASSSSSSSLALTSSSSSPTSAPTSPAPISPSTYRHQCGLCHSAQDAPIVLQGCEHEFDKSCISAYINDHVRDNSTEKMQGAHSATSWLRCDEASHQPL